jgi:biotin carboxyl carrier protein
MTAADRRSKAPVAPGDGRDGHEAAGRGGSTEAPTVADRVIDPRAVRVALGTAFGHVGLDPMVVEPPSTVLAPTPSVSGVGILGGTVAVPLAVPVAPPPPPSEPLPVQIDGVDASAVILHQDAAHVTLVVGSEPSGESRPPIRILLEAAEAPPDGRGASRREVVVDGWRIELEIESERRAALRDRARRGREESARGGPTEVHAIIPGRVVSVSVSPGDAIVASQQLLVVEAMKMQNELRAPRDGTISKVGVTPGDLIEIGDLLLVLE